MLQGMRCELALMGWSCMQLTEKLLFKNKICPISGEKDTKIRYCAPPSGRHVTSYLIDILL